MRHSMRLAGIIAAALTASGLAAPSGGAVGDHFSPAVGLGRTLRSDVAVTGFHRYRLATGDTLQVLTRANGTVATTLAGRRPFIWSGRPGDRYVVPRTKAAHLSQLDLSLFDANALARVTRHGRTPVIVRLAPDAELTHHLRGLRIHAGGSRAVGRGTELRGSYGRHFTGFTTRDLRGVTSVRLAAPRPRPLQTTVARRIRSGYMWRARTARPPTSPW